MAEGEYPIIENRIRETLMNRTDMNVYLKLYAHVCSITGSDFLQLVEEGGYTPIIHAQSSKQSYLNTI